jgi:glycerophosphoryl diester phosphodiesterase
MTRADWIAERPVAHRGLHDVASGIVENTAGAFEAAVEAGYAMECDVQVSSDGEAMVFHDDSLDRLMLESGRVDARSSSSLRAVAMKVGTDRMISLGELCDLIAGRAPVIVEVKASWSRDRRLERRVSAILSAYRGPVAVMSFDPGSAAWFRDNASQLPRGVVQESLYDDPEWNALSPVTKFALGHLLHLPKSRPDFLAWYVRDVARRTPQMARRALGLPMLTWTVRTPADQARAALYADQMIFEGVRP